MFEQGLRYPKFGLLYFDCGFTGVLDFAFWLDGMGASEEWKKGGFGGKRKHVTTSLCTIVT